MRILMTCFMPFRNRPKNGSQVLARYLQRHYLQDVDPRDEVRIIDIPVRWGAVEAVAGPVIENWQPDIILGLGEGSDTSIAIETTGRNTREGNDVDGTPSPESYILEDGESERKSTLSFAWSHQIALPLPLKISIDAGTYLCNNALYFFCGTRCDLVGFIHVPPQGDTEEQPYCNLYGPILLEILRQNTRETILARNTHA